VDRIKQRFALATFRHATGGDNSWSQSARWLQCDVHECLWCSPFNFNNTPAEAVGEHDPKFRNPCEKEDPSHGVSEGVCPNLWSWGNRLVGTLPPETFMLTELKSLSLTTSDLTGTISTLICELQSLEAVGIAGTGLSGTLLTEIGLLQNLTFTALIWNQLAGSLPSVRTGQTLRCDDSVPRFKCE